MTVCGNIGIGRIEGEYNSAGSRQFAPDDPEPELAGEALSDAQLAVKAVEAAVGSMWWACGRTGIRTRTRTW